jgi:primosomal protein N' (replication factor Y) (superfamily II helicase)
MSTQQQLFARDPDPWEVDDAAELLAAQVVFAEAPFGPYDYAVPESMRGGVTAGVRLKVPLGRQNRPIVGYCTGVGRRAANARKLKNVQALIDAHPLLSPAMMRLAEWMADHYLCELGQVFEALVPAGVRGQAGTREMTFLSVPSEIAARLSTLKLPPKQFDALRALASASRPLTPPELAKAARCTLAPIQELRKKKLVKATVSRIQTAVVDAPPEPRQSALRLEADQQAALEAILAPLHAARHETILLHGVTGSGKTEVYIRAIDEVLHYGRQAIVLVPEISLTPQTRQRFRSRFGRVAVLHSHLNDAERHWHWQQIAAGEIDVVVGARSAVFAPTPRLGLVVIDEEHDSSFKQDSVPRYHARDVALFRCRMENVPLVLGTATPSLESYRATTEQTPAGERSRLVAMPRRVNRLPLPDVGIIDLRNEMRTRGGKGAISRPLYNAIRQTLDDGGQVILLLNRRGYSTHVQCPACGFVARCPNCDISLTHHKEGERLLCHYCEHECEAPAICPDCKFDGIRYAGLGTERLEQEVRGRFPNVGVLRMDSDTMRKPGSHEEALDRFRSGEAQILLGTQMIAKGLDFPNVMLVGVVNADTALHFPDFRASERTFQIVTQVAGRTGRGERGGRVLVQTFSPDHPAILAAMKHDYEAFARYELPIREEFGYPPYRELIRVIVRGESQPRSAEFAEAMAESLRSALLPLDDNLRVLGPAPCPLAKLRNQYRFHALISSRDFGPLRKKIREVLASLPQTDEIQWAADVDPQDLL